MQLMTMMDQDGPVVQNSAAAVAVEEATRVDAAAKKRAKKAYTNAKQRRLNERDPHYSDYGGRGIEFAPEWLGAGGATRFFLNMGPCPPGMSLERVNNNLGYFPDNCVWATQAEQNRNRRGTLLDECKVREIRKLLADGVRQRVIAQRYGVSVKTVSAIKTGKRWAGVGV